MMTRVVMSYIAILAILGITLFGIGPASANPRFTLTVSHTRLVSGHALTVTATSNVTCEWGIRWAGHTRLKRNAKVLVAHFIAPRVTKARKYRLLAICNYRARTAASTTRPGPARTTHHRVAMPVKAIVPPHWFRTIVITVEPRRVSTKPSTAVTLPDTGGPLGSLFVVGFGLVLTGAGAMRLARRRLASN